MAKVKILIGNVKGPKGDGAVIDPTLSIEGQVADAAAVGEKFVDLSDDISTVTSIAKGKNQALAYESYAEMIAALNAMDDTELNRGQNIYIATVGVPDLWIYSVKDSSVAYTYSDDNAFVTELKENATVQIGYYRVAQLETQKVDLSAYYTGSKVDALLQSKQNNLGFTPAKASDLNNYLPKSGGTMTGDIDTSGGAIYPVDGNVYINAPQHGITSFLTDILHSKQNNLGFTPIRQGGGANQYSNTVYIGWSADGLRVQVDATDLGVLVFKNDLNSYLPISGGNIYGTIEMNGNILGSVGDIWIDGMGFIKGMLNSYATKEYVDQQVRLMLNSYATKEYVNQQVRLINDTIDTLASKIK